MLFRSYPQRIVPNSGEWIEKVIVGRAEDTFRKFTVGTFVTDVAGAEYMDSISLDKLKRLPPGHLGPKVEITRK